MRHRPGSYFKFCLKKVTCVLLGTIPSLLAMPGQEEDGYTLVINEFMARNETTIEDPDDQGEFEDWLEIYNYGDTPINLGGFYLTDDLDDPTQYQIPLGHPELTTISGKGCLLLWGDSDPKQGPLHPDLRLDGNGGEEIGLYIQDQTGFTLIDGLSFDKQAVSTYQAVPMTDNGNGEYIAAIPSQEDLTFLGKHSANYTENYIKKTNDFLIK